MDAITLKNVKFIYAPKQQEKNKAKYSFKILIRIISELEPKYWER